MYPIISRRQAVVGRHYGLENAIDARLNGEQWAHELVHVMTIREFCGCRVRLRTHSDAKGRPLNPNLSSATILQPCDGPCTRKTRKP